MSLYDWLAPDLGFPDKKMWERLSKRYPSENWSRARVHDIYRWYEVAINQHAIPYYDVDIGDQTIFNWIKQHTPYSSTQIDHFAEVFDEGIREMWIEPKYVGIGSAPSQIGLDLKNVADEVADTYSPTKAIDRIKWLAIIAIVGYSAYHVMPIIGKLGKKLR